MRKIDIIYLVLISLFECYKNKNTSEIESHIRHRSHALFVDVRKQWFPTSHGTSFIKSYCLTFVSGIW